MKRFIFRCILFLFTLALSYFVALFILANLPAATWYYIQKVSNVPAGIEHRGNHTLERFRDLKDEQHVDILFLGSSHSYRTFDSQYLRDRGFSSFNLSTGAQTPMNSYFLFHKFEDRLTPDLIIYEVNPVIMEKDGTESLLDLLANTDLKKELFHMAFATRNILAINGFFRNIFDLDYAPASEIDPNLYKTDEYFEGGFVKSSRMEFAPYHSREQKIKNHAVQMKYLEKLYREARMEGYEKLVVVTPMYRGFLEDMVNYKDWSKQMADLAAEYGIHYIDYNQFEELTQKKYFYDYQHLNSRGVERFNEVFYDQLGDYLERKVDPEPEDN